MFRSCPLLILSGLFACFHAGGVHAQCLADAGPAVSVCAGSSATLNANVGGAGTAPYNYSWSPTIGLSDPSVADPELTVALGATTYTVTITDAMGCVSASNVLVTGYAPMTAEFTTAPGTVVCPFQVVTFTDVSGSSSDPVNTGSKRVWTIAPGPGWTLLSGTLGTMNGQPGDPDQWTAGSTSVSIQYQGAGNSLVSLHLSSTCGSSSSTGSITIGAAPNAPSVASNSPVCAGQTLSLSAAPINGVTYLWSGPGGYTSTQPSVTLPNANAGLIGQWAVTANNGTCASQASFVNVNVTPPPVISVTPAFSAYCAGGSTTMNATGAVNYTWYAGGAVLGNGNTQTVTPSNTTTYTVTGSVNGCSGFATATILVHPVPNASFESNASACIGEVVPFTSTGSGASGYQWDLGDGGNSFTASTSHMYSDPGVYPVSLIATTSAGCVDTATASITVWDVPTAALGLDVEEGCAPLSIDFTNLSQGDDLSTFWDFGSGSSSQEVDADHLFEGSGLHPISLTVSNPGGCSDTAWTTVMVHESPVSAFLLPEDHSCEVPYVLEIQNNSVNAGSFAWTFGNGANSAEPQPSVLFEEPGEFQLELVASNAFGCSDTMSSFFHVYPTVQAAFSMDATQICVGNAVQFANSSMGAVQLMWDMGDGTYTDSFDPEHVFGTSGSFDVQLVVLGEGACSDTALVADAIEVLDSPYAVPTLVAEDGPGNSVRLFDAGSGADAYLWDLGDGTNSMEPELVHLFPSEGGTFEVCLTVLNDNGCSDTHCELLELPSAPQVFAPNTFTPDGDGINDIFHVVLDGYGEWNFAIQVFDRWGELLFESSDPYQGWDGTSKSSEAPSGVYVWRVQLKRGGGVHTVPGHITLIR